MASGLAEVLGLPLFSKDTIKEALMDQLGCVDVDQSQRLGVAAIEVMFALAGRNVAGVLDSTWRPSLSRQRLATLPGRLLEVFCDCPPEVARGRYLARADRRHAGHFDAARGDDDSLWVDAARPIDGGWRVIRVDTVWPVDFGALAQRLREVFA